jgi:hypothetical protein
MAVLTGMEEQGQLGMAVAALGDVNRDGYDDLAVAAPYAQVNMYSVNGPFSGNLPVRLAAGVEVEGNETLGDPLVNGGDQDGDGIGDILASDCVSPDFRGATYVLSSQVFGVVDVGAATTGVILGNADDACTGSSLLGNFDWQGDGQGDVAVAQPFGSRSEFAVFDGPIVGDRNFDSDASILVKGAHLDGIGWPAVIQDVDGDGINDLIASASGHSDGTSNVGEVCLFRDLARGVIGEMDADRCWTGTQGAQEGWGLAVSADEDGDGYSEIWTSDYDHSLGLLSGTTRRFSAAAIAGNVVDVASASVISHSGYIFPVASDLNLDGQADLVIADESVHGTTSGAVFVFYGPIVGTTDTSAADAWYWGPDGLGGSVSLAGDTDADGNPEIVVGAASADNFTGEVLLLEIQIW